MDMLGGTWSEDTMTAAIETAEIAVVVLSPEFVARKWPMKELLCFFRSCEKTDTDGRQLSVLIPLFYRLSIIQLYDEPRLDRVDGNGKEIYRESQFFERMENIEPEASIANIRVAIRKIHGTVGVETYVDASNDSTNKMFKRTNVLLNEICKEVRKVIRGVPELRERNDTQAQQRPEDFCNYYSFDEASYLALDFSGASKVENARTVEADVLRAVLDALQNRNVHLNSRNG